MKTVMQILQLKRCPDTKQPKNSDNAHSDKLKQRGMSFIKYVAICLLTGVFVYRLAFDWDMYFNGASLEMRHESRSGYDYLLRLPSGYHVFSGKRPLLIYLHGVGETGKDIAELKNSNPSWWSHDYVEINEYPFITVASVTETNGWNPERLKILVEELLSNRDRFAIDETRVYLTGYSMGGFGTFETAEMFPELFAAIAPVAVGNNREKAEQLKKIPVWAFHGDQDTVVPYLIYFGTYSFRWCSKIQRGANTMRQAIEIELTTESRRRQVFYYLAVAQSSQRLYLWFNLKMRGEMVYRLEIGSIILGPAIRLTNSPQARNEGRNATGIRESSTC